jgi:hypothetical protein
MYSTERIPAGEELARPASTEEVLSWASLFGLNAFQVAVRASFQRASDLQVK